MKEAYSVILIDQICFCLGWKKRLKPHNDANIIRQMFQTNNRFFPICDEGILFAGPDHQISTAATKTMANTLAIGLESQILATPFGQLPHDIQVNKQEQL